MPEKLPPIEFTDKNFASKIDGASQVEIRLAGTNIVRTLTVGTLDDWVTQVAQAIGEMYAEDRGMELDHGRLVVQP